MLKGLDPANLPDESVGFSDTILGITFHGSASVSTFKFKKKLSFLQSLSMFHNTKYVL